MSEDQKKIMEEIEALKAKREVLEADLAKGLTEQRELAIQQRIIGIGNEITALYTLQAKAPIVDERSLFQRAVDQMVYDPVQTGAPAVSAMILTWWSACHFYMQLRHDAAPYTDVQKRRRQFFFRLNSPYPAGATRIGVVSASILVIKGLIRGSLPREVPVQPDVVPVQSIKHLKK